MLNRLVIAAMFYVLSLSACTKKNHLEYGLEVKDTLRINLMQEPPTMDWNKSTDTTSSLILNNVMDTLLTYREGDLELNVAASLATEWTPSQGAKVWTFTLRNDVKWTDGQPFTAQNIVDGWERLLNPATASEYAYYLFPLKNGKAYNSGQVKDFKQVGVKVNDKGQLVVELEKPMAFFPMLVTHIVTAPIRADLIAKYGNKWTDPDKFVTLGPYKMKVWDHDKNIVLERYEEYYGEKPKIKNVLAYMINEYSTALNLYDSGKLDFQETLPFNDIPRYRTKPGYHAVPSLGSYFYGFNTRKPPFNDVKVRKAFIQAIDRKQITDLLAGGQAPLSSWIPSGMFGYDKDIGLNFNPQAAAKLLDEAGFKDRSKFPQISIGFNTNENHQRIAENVQAQIKKNLGINVQLSNEEWKVYLNRLHNDTPSIYRMSWLADYPDPDNFITLMLSNSDNNHTGWKNKTYDGLAEAGAATLDKDKRKAIYSQTQKLLTETDAPVFPIYSDVRPILLSDRVQNFPLNALNRWIFKGVSFK